MHKRDSKTHRYGAPIVDQPKNNAWEITEEEAENVNPLKSLVQIVAEKILFHSNQQVIDQFFAVIVSRPKDKDSLKDSRESRRILIRRRQKGT